MKSHPELEQVDPEMLIGIRAEEARGLFDVDPSVDAHAVLVRGRDFGLVWSHADSLIARHERKQFLRARFGPHLENS